MALTQFADQLQARFPQARIGLEHVKRLDREANSLAWIPFYEPVSVIEPDERGRGQQSIIDADMLGAWAKHIGYSMRVRMRSFEPTVLQELLKGNSLVASTVLRAHLEAAAMASLCVQRLNEARTADGLTSLASLIPKTLFGTALYNKSKKDERVLDMLTSVEQQTITICTAVEAFDSFTYGDAADGRTAILYALLCEFSHPNNRGTKGFVKSQDVHPEGWEIAYSLEEAIAPASVVGIVDGLRLSMRGGYAASEVLRVAQFSNDALPYRGLPEEEGDRIWKLFLAGE